MPPQNDGLGVHFGKRHDHPQVLDGLHQQHTAVAVLDVGRMDDGLQQQSLGVYQDMAFLALDLEKTRLDPPDSVGSSSDLALRWSTESHQWHPSPTLGALPKSSPEAAMRGGADAGLEVGNAPRDYGTGCLWSIPSDTSDRSSVDLYN